MEKVRNVEVYNNDDEIIDILSKLPPIEECGYMNLLQFMQDQTENSDFGTVIIIDGIVYAVYKFNKQFHLPETARYFMTISQEKYTLEQHNIWSVHRKLGLSLSNKIYDVINEKLIIIYASYNLCLSLQ